VFFGFGVGDGDHGVVGGMARQRACRNSAKTRAPPCRGEGACSEVIAEPASADPMARRRGRENEFHLMSTLPGFGDCQRKAHLPGPRWRLCLAAMNWTLALRPKGTHPLHVLWSSRSAGQCADDSLPEDFRRRVLAGCRAWERGESRLGPSGDAATRCSRRFSTPRSG
jgi:hypothetical protein